MKLNSIVLALGLAVLQGLAQATPAVLDFNADAPAANPPSFIEQGMRLSDPDSWAVTAGGAACSPQCADDGSNYLLMNDSTLTLAAVSGAGFSLLQFDAAEGKKGRASSWAQSIHVVGTLAGGAKVSADFRLDALQDGSGPGVDFQTFVLPTNFTNLASVKFSGTGNDDGASFSLDNVAFDRGSPVPEPGTLALAVLGLVGLKLRAARRNTALRVA
jgi:hypothetical protein